MNGERVNEIFELALAASADERAGVVERECAGDGQLREAVLALLAALDRAGGFLSSPTAAGVMPAPGEGPGRSASLVGAVLGPYKLLELIGEGGFGTVYKADQTGPIRRRVAVKVLKPGMDSRSVVARFEQERQALAMMDHPNIARVFDAGTTPAELGTLPYFVMELVRGVPITRFCDEARLTPRERLELLVPVCRAVQHAHSKGVIHRDIKPSNVLVTLHDGVPTPKVIDFGIAKATVGALTERTVFTEFRAFVGTPAYMSPEQAEMSSLDIDTRSDVYSLGVLMYELLTGSTPFESAALARAGLAEMQRIIREEDPPRPSTRVSTAGDRLRVIADQRRMPAERLGRFVRGELDWIVMKAMEKDRSRRYGTAEALAEDIGRYLTQDPVEAAPPSRVYRLGKFARRQRTLLAGIAVLVAGVALGLAGLAVGLGEARAGQRAAEEQASAARRSAAVANLAAASAAIKAADGAEAYRQLELIPEAERGWEWRHVRARLAPTVREWRVLEPGGIVKYRVSPDGRWAVAHRQSTRDATLFRTDDPGERTSLELPQAAVMVHPLDGGAVVCVVEQPRGRQSWECVTRAWHVAERRVLWERPGQMIVTAGSDRAVFLVGPDNHALVSLADGSEISPLPQGWPVFGPTGLTWGEHVLTRDGAVVNALDGGVVTSVPGGDLSGAVIGRTAPALDLFAAVAAPDGPTSRLRVWRSDGTVLFDRFMLWGAPYFSADGEHVWIEDARTLRTVPVRRPFEERVLLLPEGEWAWVRQPSHASPMSLLGDESGRLIEVALVGEPGPWLFWAPFMAGASAVDVSADTALLATADWGAVSLFDARTGAPLWRRGGWSRFLRAVAIAPDGRAVAAAGERGRWRLYDARDGRVIASSAPVPSIDVTGLRFLNDGRSLLAAYHDGALRLFSVASPQTPAVTLQGRGAAIDQIELSPDGSMVLLVAPGTGAHVGQHDRADALPDARDDIGLTLRSASDLSLVVHRAMADDPPGAAAFSPDGRLVAWGTQAGNIVIADARTLRPVRTLGAVGRPVRALAWSADGGRMFVGDSDAVRVLDSQTGGVTLLLSGYAAKLLRFSAADGSLVAAGPYALERFETTLPPAETLIERELVKLAMGWVAQSRGNRQTAARARPAFEQDTARGGEVRRRALAFIDALGDHPAELNNRALLEMIYGAEGEQGLALAMDCINAAISLVPDAPNFRLTRASVRSKMGRHAEARADLDEARRLYAAAPDLRAPLLDAIEAELLHAGGDAVGAAAALARARAALDAVSDPQRREDLEQDLRDAEEAIAAPRPAHGSASPPGP